MVAAFLEFLLQCRERGPVSLVSLAVGIARKGWVTPEATLNARSAGELEAWLGQRRGTPLPEP